MQPRRPSLTAAYSQNRTTVFVAPEGTAARTGEAFVFCQHKQRACRRDSFAHGMHTALFNMNKGVRRALCLPAPAGQMQFPISRQGRAPMSPLRESPPPLG